MTTVNYEDFLNKDDYYKESDFLEEYGQTYSVFTANTLLVKNRELFEKYKNSNVTSFRTQRGYSSISQDLLIDLLTNEGLYSYVLKNMADSKGIIFRMILIEDGEIKDNISVTRTTLAKAIDKLNLVIEGKETGKLKMRMALLTNMSTVHSLRSKYESSLHRSYVDGELVEIPCLDLYALLNLSEMDYNEIINDDKDIEFIFDGKTYSYPKRVVVYMLIDFIESERILEKYLIPEIALERYISLYSGNIVDCESINKNEKTNDDYIDGISMSDLINLDPEFENEVLKDMNPTYSLLESAIYIYYRLCELLSYDQEFYAANQKGESAEKHCDINHINSINIENNEVVFYEFIAIYSYFLKKLGIKYTVDNAFKDEYGKGHSTISFKVGEYLVTADSTLSILQNDMTSAKINAPLRGIRLTNKNIVTRNKFLETLRKVTDEIYENKKNKLKFEEAVRSYESKYAELHLSKKEKLYMLFEEIGNTNLKGIDVISVHSRIYDHFFKNDYDIDINFISNATNAYKDYNYTPLTVLSVRISEGEYIYYQIDPNNPSLVESITEDEIRDLFESRDYAYIGKQEKVIPGINLESREKYVR